MPALHRKWSLYDTYGFFSTFIARAAAPKPHLPRAPRDLHTKRSYTCGVDIRALHRKTARRSRAGSVEQQGFHDYFVTHLPTSSLHPDSGSLRGPHHKLPRSESVLHTTGSGQTQAAALPGVSRELTVVRIPLKKAKHHYGAATSRGQRPYNEDTYQAGTIEIPAFAKKTPVSLSRSGKNADGSGTNANSRGGDPQVFYFGIFDGHGGSVCSDFLRDELHDYIEKIAELFQLKSSLQNTATPGGGSNIESELPAETKEDLFSAQWKKPDPSAVRNPDSGESEHAVENPSSDEEVSLLQGPNHASSVYKKAILTQWREVVGGYFRRFSPEHFSCDDSSPVSIESVMLYAFLQADLDFISAQAAKPFSTDDQPLNAHDVLDSPSLLLPKHRIGGPTRFVGGSTCSLAMISTPSPTPYWHPASPCTLLISHVGDTRILLCSTATGRAIPLTTNHHPSSPVEIARLRRYASSVVADSFGEERISGLANTRAFGDMGSKRLGVSAEPETYRYELGPAEYSFIVLVSDGISGSMSDQEIVDVVKEANTPEKAAAALVAFATETSKDGDNATALVARLGGWERREEGGGGGMGTRGAREFRIAEAQDPRTRRR